MSASSTSSLSSLPLDEIVVAPGLSDVPGLLTDGKVLRIPRNLKPTSSYLLGINTEIASSNQHISVRFSQIGALLNNIMEVLSYSIVHQIPRQAIGLEKALEDITLTLENHLAKIIDVLEVNRQNIHLDFKEKEREVFSKYEILYSHQKIIVQLLTEQKELLLQMDPQDTVSKVKHLEETLETYIAQSKAKENIFLDKIDGIEKYLKNTLGE